MFGDVFNNRLGDQIIDDVSESNVSWQPVVDPIGPYGHSNIARNKTYGYDPWTKTAFRLDRGIRWWCYKPKSVVWQASVQYTLGSVLFVVASIFALFHAVREDAIEKRWLFTFPYALGSIMYTIGASLLLGVSWYNHPDWTHPLETQAVATEVQPPPSESQAVSRTWGQDIEGGDGEYNSVQFNLSRPASFNSALLPAGGGTPSQSSRIFTESLPPSAAPSVRTAESMARTSLDTQPLGTKAQLVVKTPGGADSAQAPSVTPLMANADGVPPATPFDGSEVLANSQINESTPLILNRGTDAAASYSEVGGLKGKCGNDSSAWSPTGSLRGSVDESLPVTPAPPSSQYVQYFMNRWRTTSTAENITTALLSHPARAAGDMDSVIRQFYTRDAYYYIHTDPWYETRWRLDLLGSFSIWVGAILYNIACFSSAYNSIFYHWPRIFADQELCVQVLDAWPDIIGGLLFVLGSWFFWWSAHETPSLIVNKPFTLVWWLTVFNLVGSVGFFYGAAFEQKLLPISGLVDNWIELLVGYVFGSLFFLIGSYLMIVEVATVTHH